MFILNNKKYPYTVDYHSKFPIMKKAEDMLADSLILEYKVVFSEYGLPKKIMSDAGGNFISDKFQAVLQKYEHRKGYIIIIPSLKQQIGRGVYKIHKAYYENVLKLMKVHI